MKLYRVIGFVLTLLILKLVLSDVFTEFENMLITAFNAVEILLASVVEAPFFNL